MKVTVAGYNIDKGLIDQHIPAELATPEVISAAYARISRSSKTAEQLRADALLEIPKARISNQKIVFEMGHSSIAEHAVFNLDLIGISRYLAEYIQRSRLASYTEKSQRYVTFHKDYIIPGELTDSARQRYISLMDDLFELYQKSTRYLSKRSIAKSNKEAENNAKEDARYLLPLSTKTQMGMTINARSIEVLLRRLHALQLTEARELYEKIYTAVHPIAPSLIRYTEEDALGNILLSENQIKHSLPERDQDSVRILDHSPHPDERILAALLYERSNRDFEEILHYVRSMDSAWKEHLCEDAFDGIKSWHKLPRAFEMCDFTLEFRMSKCCYAQFKRHRLCSMIHQTYRFDNDFVIPPQIQNTEFDAIWRHLLGRAEDLSQSLKTATPLLSPYCLTNAHTISVLVRMNLRELYHFVRLRSDIHSQWEIRQISQKLSHKVRALCPLTARYLMGKSEFGQIN